MPRSALKELAALSLAAASLWLPRPAAGLDPHVDPGRTPGGCSACHAGHGASRSPMLPEPQRQLCERCHGHQADLGRQVVAGRVAADARPPLLGSVLAQPFTHPIDEHAFSAAEPGSVTCTSCHSPHRAMAETAGGAPAGQRKLSPKNPNRFEFQLCQRCHGSAGAGALADIGDLIDPRNPSYHPVQAPATGGSPSVLPRLAGKEINCTDCHGNSAAGARGPHGSLVRFLLRSGYTTSDGAEESPSTYDLCYDCHERATLLDDTTFPEHRLHVVEERTSCSTCHDPHGSVQNRALIRFYEGAFVTGVSASGSTGRLAFVSDGPGSGACYLTCHGEDHGPESYGGLRVLQETLSTPGTPGALPELRSPPPRPFRRPSPASPSRVPPDRPPPGPGEVPAP